MLKLMISPGPAASADIVAWPDSAAAEHCLRLNLDPAQIAIHVPDGPDGREQLAAFLRTLSQHAGPSPPSPNARTQYSWTPAVVTSE